MGKSSHFTAKGVGGTRLLDLALCTDEPEIQHGDNCWPGVSQLSSWEELAK